ncbi:MULTISPECIES: cation diffusion facilitator family transporter [unclassified Streptococcus]|uniref:cation diffusion facilitator family transporter n=1 Tax=unclassified Streptococcus TaxID=2608887 RepID=UPI00107193D9|nr:MULTISPECIES: cation diffusion facilitator family transporter [unclassified Streptococcus]MBF0786449.1 cation transporter [Streptococcus sp. 19428wC2_LYSM12]MCQ9212558.1 cation diffusion facilitator family transporter [Streptococcus sp. B01]MCQ9213897.1 cation diffusion facilitator family transporter [Streptococcus sp. O1]TFV06856.1 cation transporter [Streptococcus sp. LYSM12]
MSSSKKIFIAFILNLTFSMVEFIFGILFHSSAILADAVHDFGDALAIGSSAMMQQYANKPANSRYPFGYKRWNILAAMLTSSILILGSLFIVLENIPNLLNPQPVNQEGMFILGIVAVMMNLLAAHVIKDGHSHNESILSLHFLEDILGWIAVILVSIILQFSEWYILDPLLSLGISIFILSKALPKAWNHLQILLEAAPAAINVEEIRSALLDIEGIEKIEELKIWTLDGFEHCGTAILTVSSSEKQQFIKEKVRWLFYNHAIGQVTIEILEASQSSSSRSS